MDRRSVSHQECVWTSPPFWNRARQCFNPVLTGLPSYFNTILLCLSTHLARQVLRGHFYFDEETNGMKDAVPSGEETTSTAVTHITSPGVLSRCAPSILSINAHSAMRKKYCILSRMSHICFIPRVNGSPSLLLNQRHRKLNILIDWKIIAILGWDKR
jgi:hypothetical protein